jgi:hypothetical protein
METDYHETIQPFCICLECLIEVLALSPGDLSEFDGVALLLTPSPVFNLCQTPAECGNYSKYVFHALSKCDA